jgi:hypothetical protein
MGPFSIPVTQKGALNALHKENSPYPHPSLPPTIIL